MVPGTVTVYRRRNALGIRGKWSWKLVAANGNNIANGGQGYANKADAVEMAHRVTSGEYADAAFYVEGGLA